MKATCVAAVLFCAIPFTLFATEIPSHVNTSKPVQVKEKINLNTASVTMLVQSIKGIGIKRAQAIISYREQNGKFKSIDDLSKVHGIGPNFVTKNKKELLEVFLAE